MATKKSKDKSKSQPLKRKFSSSVKRGEVSKAEERRVKRDRTMRERKAPHRLV